MARECRDRPLAPYVLHACGVRWRDRDDPRLSLKNTIDKLPIVDNFDVILGDGDRPVINRCAAATCRLMVWAALALFCGCTPSAAGAIDDEAIAHFETFCLENLNAPDRAIALVGVLGLTEVTDANLRSIMLADHPGHAWMNPREMYLFRLTDDGACTIASSNVNGKLVLQLFLTLSRNTHLSTEKAGSNTNTIFAVTHPDPRGAGDAHAIVMVTTSDLPSIDGATFTSVPEKLAKAAGISVPQVWP